jgi:hypothetical protein
MTGYVQLLEALWLLRCSFLIARMALGIPKMTTMITKTMSMITGLVQTMGCSATEMLLVQLCASPVVVVELMRSIVIEEDARGWKFGQWRTVVMD